jgi:two-component system OmpR family sensor kinase
VRRFPPASLRGRLLAGILALVTVGLVGTDVVAYQLLRASLYHRVDAESTADAARTSAMLRQVADRRVTPNGLSKVTFGGDVLIYYAADGAVVYPTSPSASEAALVRALGPLPADTVAARASRFDWYTAGGVPYRVAYRVTAGPVLVRGPTDPGTRVAGIVVARSFATERDALDRLASIEAAVTAVALVALAGVAVLLLRLGLRPLAQVTGVATAIAAGDTGRRVPADRRVTEIDRLAGALNTAFEQRQRAEDRLRRFVADASHELRTPLTTIRGWAELYFQDDPAGAAPDPEAVRTAMSRIAGEATRMTHLVEELLLLARLEGPRPLDAAPVDLAAVAREVADDARVVDPDRPLALSTPDGPVPVPGDADRLRQVLRNLIGNAFQHTPPGTPVRVALSREPGTVTLTVADGGPGIPDADRPHLFERFYRGDTSGDRTGGAGLGLAIVHAIVTAHHGTITTVPTTTGATFVLTLPAGTP